MWDKELNIKQVDNLVNEIKPRHRVKRPQKGWIRLFRTALGMSTRVLGEGYGLSQSRISLIEKGEAKPGVLCHKATCFFFHATG
ncbi:helix-turn-helix domain-containing protein [Ewingella sp. S1.OA.A_B6]